MAKVEQKVGLDITEYVDNAKKLSRTTKVETDQVNKAFNEAGDEVKTFSDRTKKNINEVNKTLGDFVKGFKASIGLLSAVGVGLTIGSAITKEVAESLNFDDVINKAAARAGLNKTQQAIFRNSLLDVSSRRNVEEEEVAAAADVALSLGAVPEEAVKFADVIAATTKSVRALEGQSASLAKEIAIDIRARGGEVTGESARASIEAVLTGTRQGIGSFNEILSGLRELPGIVQERAGLTQRDLVELLGGAGGVAADPDIVNDAVRSLIKATDSIESRGAVQGVLGTQLRDAEGTFDITAKNLDEIAANLAKIGTEQQQRAVLRQIPGLDEQAAEGLLAITRDREGFVQARERARADRPQLEQVFDKSTEGFLENVGSFFNKLGNDLFKKSEEGLPERARRGQFGNLTSFTIGKTQERLNEEFKERQLAPTRLTAPSPAGQALRSAIRSARTDRQQAQLVAPVGGPRVNDVNVKIEVDSKDPGLMGRPKSTDLQRTTGGL